MKRWRFRLLVQEEYQPLGVVPRWLWVLAAAALVLQLLFHFQVQGAAQVDRRGLELQPPPSAGVLQAMALGDPLVLGRVLMLNLQAFDNQQGESISFYELNYDILGQWLDRIVALDEKAEYPHFSAAKIYTSVLNNKQVRIMIEWVRRHFANAPDARWEWMAHAAHMAQYTLEDRALARALAEELHRLTTPGKVPGWSRQMGVFFLENGSEYEASAAMLANLLDTGEVDDPNEFKFLLTRLEDIICKAVKSGDIRSIEKFNAIKRQRVSLLKEYWRRQDEDAESLSVGTEEITCPDAS